MRRILQFLSMTCSVEYSAFSVLAVKVDICMVAIMREM